MLIAATIEAAEAILLLVASGWAAYSTVHGDTYLRSSGYALSGIGVGLAIALGFVARGLRSGRRWTRTPALLTQLFTGIAAITLLQGGRLDWGIPALALGVAGVAALLAPPSLRVLTPGRPESGRS